MESGIYAGAGAGLKLIETLLWDGEGLVRLALHLERLERSALLLGWECDLPSAEVELCAAAPDSPARMRLTLDASGQIAVQVAALPEAKAEWRVGLTELRLDSGDPWLRVKSTKRAGYDAARAAMPGGLDEVIFLNERGEVCDGTITTVFFDRGQGMRTPPVTSGLLPGVLRAELAVPEEVLMGDELSCVRLWVGTSLRGLIPARWVI